MLEMRTFIERTRRLVINLSAQPVVGTTVGPWHRAKAVLQQRQRRSELFGEDLFSDPVWDMLLLLFSEQPIRDHVKVRDFQFLARVPMSTTLRWLAVLEDRGLIWRRGDDADRRATNVGLTKRAGDLMMAYFAS
jgi:DNA-binding MarR family transcriptional regulator